MACAGTDRHTTGERQREVRSLAVLPLQNFSGNPEQDYLSDGMTEALIARLSAIHALRVISRTSAMQYKGTRKSVPAIGKELNVDAVIEGSVLRSGDKIRVTVQLIRADTDEHLCPVRMTANCRTCWRCRAMSPTALRVTLRSRLVAHKEAHPLPHGR